MSHEHNNNYQAAFAVFPQRIWNLPGITLAYLRIYETIFQFWNHGSLCYLTNAAILQRTGVASISTLIDAFQFFEKHNELKRSIIDGKRYLIQPERKIETDTEPPPDKPTKSEKNQCDKGVSTERYPPYRCSDT